MTADELARAFEFLASGDMAGTRREATRHGLMVWTPRLPLRHDSNYLLVDALQEDVTAGDLASDAERGHTLAAVGDRLIFVRDKRTGERFTPEFAALGWEVSWSVVMAHHRPPERTADTATVAELTESEIRPAREADIRRYPWGTPEVARQLLDARRLIPVDVRFFAVLADGEPVSFADLYLGEGVAQVESVATVDAYRNRGYASAVVLRAVEEARQAGAELVFLVALADDWPRELYRRLGFDEIGQYVKFLKRK